MNILPKKLDHLEGLGLHPNVVFAQGTKQSVICFGRMGQFVKFAFKKEHSLSFCIRRTHSPEVLFRMLALGTLRMTWAAASTWRIIFSTSFTMFPTTWVKVFVVRGSNGDSVVDFGKITLKRLGICGRRGGSPCGWQRPRHPEQKQQSGHPSVGRRRKKGEMTS